MIDDDSHLPSGYIGRHRVAQCVTVTSPVVNEQGPLDMYCVELMRLVYVR